MRRRFLTGDATHEKLAELLRDNPEGMGIACDELKRLLSSLERDGREDARGFLLEAWNGDGSYTSDRIGRGTIDTPALCLGLIGGIQPGPLSAYLRSAIRGGQGDDGFMQRFSLAVWPDVTGKWRDVDRWPDGEARRTAATIIARLASLNRSKVLALGGECDAGDEADPAAVPFLRFTSDAHVLFLDWRTGYEARLRGGELSDVMEAHLAKYRKLVPSMALLCHLAEWAASDAIAEMGPIPLTAVRRALAWADYLESHARRLYAEEAEPAVPAAHDLAKKIVAGKLGRWDENLDAPAFGMAAGGVTVGGARCVRFTLREVYRKGWSRLNTVEDAAAAIAVLVDHGWLAEVEVSGTGGRDAYELTVNPSALATAEPAGDGEDRHVGGHTQKPRGTYRTALTELTKAPSVSSVSEREGGSAGFVCPPPAAAAAQPTRKVVRI